MSKTPDLNVMERAKNVASNFMDSVHNASAKAKTVGTIVVASTLTTCAQAAVVYDETSGKLTGNIDMGGYNSALTIIIPAAVTIVVGGIILRTIKKI